MSKLRVSNIEFTDEDIVYIRVNGFDVKLVKTDDRLVVDVIDPDPCENGDSLATVFAYDADLRSNRNDAGECYVIRSEGEQGYWSIKRQSWVHDVDSASWFSLDEVEFDQVPYTTNNDACYIPVNQAVNFNPDKVEAKS